MYFFGSEVIDEVFICAIIYLVAIKDGIVLNLKQVFTINRSLGIFERKLFIPIINSIFVVLEEVIVFGEFGKCSGIVLRLGFGA